MHELSCERESIIPNFSCVQIVFCCCYFAFPFIFLLFSLCRFSCSHFFGVSHSADVFITKIKKFSITKERLRATAWRGFKQQATSIFQLIGVSFLDILYFPHSISFFFFLHLLCRLLVWCSTHFHFVTALALIS